MMNEWINDEWMMMMMNGWDQWMMMNEWWMNKWWMNDWMNDEMMDWMNNDE